MIDYRYQEGAVVLINGPDEIPNLNVIEQILHIPEDQRC